MTERTRFAELEALEDGWLDGRGKAPTRPAITTGRRLLPTLPAGAYSVFPMEDGGLSVEPKGAGKYYEIRPGGEVESC